MSLPSPGSGGSLSRRILMEEPDFRLNPTGGAYRLTSFGVEAGAPSPVVRTRRKRGPARTSSAEAAAPFWKKKLKDERTPHLARANCPHTRARPDGQPNSLLRILIMNRITQYSSGSCCGRRVARELAPPEETPNPIGPDIPRPQPPFPFPPTLSGSPTAAPGAGS